MVHQVNVVVHLYLMTMVGMNLVLGIQWFKNLGPIITYYSVLSMEFTLNGIRVRWKGGSWIDEGPISTRELHNLSSQSDTTLLCCIELESSDTPAVATVDKVSVLDEIKTVLLSF